MTLPIKTSSTFISDSSFSTSPLPARPRIINPLWESSKNRWLSRDSFEHVVSFLEAQDVFRLIRCSQTTRVICIGDRIWENIAVRWGLPSIKAVSAWQPPLYRSCEIVRNYVIECRKKFVEIAAGGNTLLIQMELSTRGLFTEVTKKRALGAALEKGHFDVVKVLKQGIELPEIQWFDPQHNFDYLKALSITRCPDVREWVLRSSIKLISIHSNTTYLDGSLDISALNQIVENVLKGGISDRLRIECMLEAMQYMTSFSNYLGRIVVTDPALMLFEAGPVPIRIQEIAVRIILRYCRYCTMYYSKWVGRMRVENSNHYLKMLSLNEISTSCRGAAVIRAVEKNRLDLLELLLEGPISDEDRATALSKIPLFFPGDDPHRKTHVDEMRALLNKGQENCVIM